MKEAINSCYNSKFKEIEIIVVNDGSTDKFTLDILNDYGNQNIKILEQPNKGAAAARNFGVSHAKGEFLLFLDSDNIIRPDYLTKSIEVMVNNPSIAVVYSKPFFFGGDAGSNRFEVRDFLFDSLLAGNYIDMCSLVRKKFFLDLGGFDENRELFFGEDWELWIRISQAGGEFYFLNEVLFEYRIRRGSLIDQVDFQKRQTTLKYLGSKHGYLIHYHYRQYFRILEKIQQNPFSYFLRILYFKYILKKPLIK